MTNQTNAAADIEIFKYHKFFIKYEYGTSASRFMETRKNDLRTS